MYGRTVQRNSIKSPIIKLIQSTKQKIFRDIFLFYSLYKKDIHAYMHAYKNLTFDEKIRLFIKSGFTKSLQHLSIHIYAHTRKHKYTYM